MSIQYNIPFQKNGKKWIKRFKQCSGDKSMSKYKKLKGQKVFAQQLNQQIIDSKIHFIGEKKSELKKL